MSDIHADISDTNPAAQGGQGTVGGLFGAAQAAGDVAGHLHGTCGLVAAPGDIHPWLALVALLAIAVGAGAVGRAQYVV